MAGLRPPSQNGLHWGRLVFRHLMRCGIGFAALWRRRLAHQPAGPDLRATTKRGQLAGSHADMAVVDAAIRNLHRPLYLDEDCFCGVFRPRFWAKMPP